MGHVVDFNHAAATKVVEVVGDLNGKLEVEDRHDVVTEGFRIRPFFTLLV